MCSFPAMRMQNRKTPHPFSSFSALGQHADVAKPQKGRGEGFLKECWACLLNFFFATTKASARWTPPEIANFKPQHDREAEAEERGRKPQYMGLAGDFFLYMPIFIKHVLGAFLDEFPGYAAWRPSRRGFVGFRIVQLQTATFFFFYIRPRPSFSSKGELMEREQGELQRRRVTREEEFNGGATVLSGTGKREPTLGGFLLLRHCIHGRGRQSSLHTSKRKGFEFVLMAPGVDGQSRILCCTALLACESCQGCRISFRSLVGTVFGTCFSPRLRYPNHGQLIRHFTASLFASTNQNGGARHHSASSCDSLAAEGNKMSSVYPICCISRLIIRNRDAMYNKVQLEPKTDSIPSFWRRVLPSDSF